MEITYPWRVWLVGVFQSLGEWITHLYLTELSLGLGQCWGAHQSCPYTSPLVAGLLSDSCCCMSGQNGGRESDTSIEIKMG